MLSQKDYATFIFKMTKILKDCYMKEPIPNVRRLTYKGNSTHTKDNVYYYNENNAKNHREALIEICKGLPRLDVVSVGTARYNSFFKLDLRY